MGLGYISRSICTIRQVFWDYICLEQLSLTALKGFSPLNPMIDYE